MKRDRRVRRLTTGRDVWYWTVRQRVRPVYADCRLTLALFTRQSGRRLVLVFAPCATGAVSNSYFAAGTVARLPDGTCLNLHEPGTVRRLLDAARPVLEVRSSEQSLEVDGWFYFAEVAGCRDTAVAGS